MPKANPAFGESHSVTLKTFNDGYVVSSVVAAGEGGMWVLIAEAMGKHYCEDWIQKEMISMLAGQAVEDETGDENNRALIRAANRAVLAAIEARDEIERLLKR